MLRFSGVLFTGALLLSSSLATAQEAIALDTPEKRFSYAIGQNVSSGIKDDLGGSGFDPEAFMAAMRDVFADGGRMSDEEMQAAFGELQAVQQEAQAQAAVAELAENRKWLEAKEADDGITATESGILYKEITAGAGAKPTAADSVTVHYTGRLIDGKVFDSSVERGEPATFPLGRVIPGWTEVMQLMPVGAKWDVWIPSDKGYGTRGAGEDIPPNAILHFTIELISIEGQ
ncbi:MAG: FKBP-type peptidyl-prolyl cis-trans isomerase [Paracoccaceae bacterium]